MDKTMYYYETGSVDPAYNLAFEEVLLTRAPYLPILMLWQNDNTIVIGRNQNTEAEIDRAYVDAHDIHVVRRTTGGGAVYHDLGNLNYSFITRTDEDSAVTKARFTEPIICALTSLGLSDVLATGRNDITICDKKISGTAERLYKDRILHHGTLLFDSDPAVISAALHVDPDKLKAKGIQSVRSRIGNIRPMLPRDMTMQEFWQYIKRSLSGHGFMEAELSDELLSEVRVLQKDKFANWEWTYGRSPALDMIRKERFAGGTLECHLSLDHGRITEIAFFGDFLSLMPISDIADALRGAPCKKDDISAILSHFDLTQYFGTITSDEIIHVITAS